MDTSMNKIKVGLYLVNKGYIGVDLSQPEKGNPGIGGTQYNFITLPYYYIKYYDDVEFVFYAHIVDTLPNIFKTVQVSDLSEAAQKAKNDECDIFIYRPTQDDEGNKFLENLYNIQIKTIAWIHNTPFKQLRKLAKNPYIVRYVNVSKEQYDMLRDHPIIYKADMICNGFDSRLYIPKEKVRKEKSVVYMGSLIKVKGFHVLARVWKKVLEKVPDVKLEVIGSGKLYDRNSKLGKWNIADESYESVFRPYLSDENGNKLDSVVFHGVLGDEKIHIMQQAMIGCPNPSGVTENCPGVAIEFQACGTAIVSGAFWGLLDTVDNSNTGLLGTTDEELVNNIVKLLNDEAKAIQLGQNGIKFIKEKFSHEKISAKWRELFIDIIKDETVEILPIDQNPDYEYKQFSEKMRLIKGKYSFLKWIPAYIELRPYHRRIKKILGSNQ
jgi:glycosyltransferase involved in cell wall biosynthesis